jgi:hypothetical protein
MFQCHVLLNRLTVNNSVCGYVVVLLLENLLSRLLYLQVIENAIWDKTAIKGKRNFLQSTSLLQVKDVTLLCITGQIRKPQRITDL